MILGRERSKIWKKKRQWGKKDKKTDNFNFGSTDKLILEIKNKIESVSKRDDLVRAIPCNVAAFVRVNFFLSKGYKICIINLRRRKKCFERCAFFGVENAITSLRWVFVIVRFQTSFKPLPPGNGIYCSHQCLWMDPNPSQLYSGLHHSV